MKEKFVAICLFTVLLCIFILTGCADKKTETNLRIAGSDFDSLDATEYVDNYFILSISSQSDDGDFAGSNSNGYPVDWVITVNEDLEITEKKRETGRDYFDTKIGEKEGIPEYKNDDF